MNIIFGCYNFTKQSVLKAIQWKYPRETCIYSVFTCLQNYLNEYTYDSTNHTGLWKALENQARTEGSDVSVPEVMDTWVLQMGYPVVTVNINRQSESAQISQKHFLMDDTKEPDPKYPSPFR